MRVIIGTPKVFCIVTSCFVWYCLYLSRPESITWSSIKSACTWLYLFFTHKEHILLTYWQIRSGHIVFAKIELVIKIITHLSWLKYSRGLAHLTIETDKHCVLSESNIWLSHIWIGTLYIKVVAGHLWPKWNVWLCGRLTTWVSANITANKKILNANVRFPDFR